MWEKNEQKSAPDNRMNVSGDGSPKGKMRLASELLESPEPKKVCGSTALPSSPAVSSPYVVPRPKPTPRFPVPEAAPEPAYQSIDQLFTKQFVPKLIPANNKKKYTIPSSYVIHSLLTLKDLIQEKKDNEIKEKPDFRFVIDSDYIVRFARESHTGISAPPHFGLVAGLATDAICLAAGNLFLSDDYSTLLKISNKSGDFTPPIDSLKWLVAILLLNKDALPFNIADTLEVKHLDRQSIVSTYPWSVHDIQSWFDTVELSPVFKNALKAQATSTKTITLQANINPTNRLSVDADDMFSSTPVALPLVPSAHSAPPVARMGMRTSLAHLQHNGSEAGCGIRTPMRSTRTTARSLLFGNPHVIPFDDSAVPTVASSSEPQDSFSLFQGLSSSAASSSGAGASIRRPMSSTRTASLSPHLFSLPPISLNDDDATTPADEYSPELQESVPQFRS